MSHFQNKNVRFTVKFAHSDGHTSHCFQKNGEGYVTGGNEGDVRHWSLREGDDCDPKNFDVGDPVYSVAVSESKFYVASECNEIRSYSLDDGSDEFTVTRFTAAVYYCDLSKDGKHLVAGGGDFLLKVVNLEDSSQITLTGHEAPVLCTVFDPLKELIASSSCDGTVRVWNIADKKCIQTWNNHEKSNEMANSKTLCHICWNSSGDKLYVPAFDKVNVYSRSSWNCIRSFSFSGFANMSICCVCPNDEYLAVSNNEGTLLVWKLNDENESPSATFVHPKKMPITSIKWYPNTRNSLSFCDQNGELYLLTVTHETISEVQFQEVCQGLFDDDDFTEEMINDDSDVPVSKPSPKSSEKPDASPTNSDVNENVNIDDVDFAADSDNEIDIGAIKLKYESKIFPADDDDKVSEEKDKVNLDNILDDISSLKSEKVTRSVGPPVNTQPAFQPGSTPVGFQHRFMVWNSVGIVTNFRSEEENTIDIEFHDTTIHHSIHFTNSYNYVIADLSAEALLCANFGDELTKSSRLFCMHFGSWDLNKEWKYELPDDEYVTALTLGTGFAAVATDRLFVRLFTVSGVQLHVLSIAGPAVCLAAQEKSFAVFYHTSCGIPGEQSISAQLMKMDLNSTFVKKECSVPVALSPKSTLYWAGFSDEGTLCTVDSADVVRMYKHFLGNSWTPILDAKRNGKNKSDHYFVIGLSEIQQQIRYVLSRGSLYPSTIPRPTLLLTDFQIPVCDATSTKSINEEQFLRLKTTNTLLEQLLRHGFDVDFQLGENESKMMTTLLKMFALALNNNGECLALEIAEMMPNKKSLELAIRYATQRRKTGLMKKISEVMQKMGENKSDDEDGVDDMDDAPTASISSQGWSSQILENKKEEFLLKPKPMRRTKQTNGESDDVPQLRPKPVKKVSRNSSNPFKISGNGGNNNDSLHKKGFDLFFETMRSQLEEQYPEIEDESELLSTAQDLFDELDEKEKKEWVSNALLGNKRKAEDSDSDSDNDSDSNSSNNKKPKTSRKLTDFFNKK